MSRRTTRRNLMVLNGREKVTGDAGWLSEWTKGHVSLTQGPEPHRQFNSWQQGEANSTKQWLYCLKEREELRWLGAIMLIHKQTVFQPSFAYLRQFSTPKAYWYVMINHLPHTFIFGCFLTGDGKNCSTFGCRASPSSSLMKVPCRTGKSVQEPRWRTVTG